MLTSAANLAMSKKAGKMLNVSSEFDPSPVGVESVGDLTLHVQPSMHRTNQKAQFLYC